MVSMELQRIQVNVNGIPKPAVSGRAYSTRCVSRLEVKKTNTPRKVDRRNLLFAGLLIPGLGVTWNAVANAAAIPMTVIPTEDVEGIHARDEAMSWKCTGGMFDCDGDRRDYAKEQYKNFLEKRKKDK